MSNTKRIEWADVEPDTSSDQDNCHLEEEQKHQEKDSKPKQPKKWHFLKVPKDKGLRQEIQQKRIYHKTQQLKTIDQLEGNIIWLYIFKNPNPELIHFVQRYPSVQTLSNHMGWDLKITKEQAKKLLVQGFGPAKVFGRMQVSRRNYEKQVPIANNKTTKFNKYQKKLSDNYYLQKQSVFQKNKKLAYKQSIDTKLKYKQKSSLQILIPSANDDSINDESKDQEQCRNSQCLQNPCRSCFQKTLVSKTSSINIQNHDTEDTVLQMTQTISSDKFQGSIFNSKQFDEISISQSLLLHDELLKQIDIPLNLEPSLQNQSLEDEKLTQISMIQGISTIMLLNQQQCEQDQDIELDLDNNLSEEVTKKKRKRTKNKQPKEKKVSNNPFDRLR